MISCSFVEITSVTSKPRKEKGIECNEKLLMKTFVLSAFLYECGGQRLSTGSAGEPVFQVLDIFGWWLFSPPSQYCISTPKQLSESKGMQQKNIYVLLVENMSHECF